MFALTYGIAATALAADQAGHPNALSRWVAPLGVLTYGIYMLHPIIRSLCYPLMMAAGFESNLAIAARSTTLHMCFNALACVNLRPRGATGVVPASSICGTASLRER